MFGPFAFGFFTLLHAGVALVALTLMDTFPAAALCLFVVEAVTAFDNGITVVGNWLGIGARAERINRLRFLLHAVCIGLLLPVYAAIGNAFAFDGVVASGIEIAAWFFALVIIIYGYQLQYKSVHKIMPVNSYGCLRYAQSVSELTRHPGYAYSDNELAAKGHLPMASIYTTLLGLIIAAATGWFGAFWVPFAVTAVMFVAGSFPMRSWGPFATSCLEVVFSTGMLYSLIMATAVS